MPETVIVTAHRKGDRIFVSGTVDDRPYGATVATDEFDAEKGDEAKTALLTRALEAADHAAGPGEPIYLAGMARPEAKK